MRNTESSLIVLQLSSKVRNKSPEVKEFKIKEKISTTQNLNSLTLKKMGKDRDRKKGVCGRRRKERKEERDLFSKLVSML